ncbi:MAG: S41 family peptidase [Aurantibacter sp.]
MKNSLFPLVLLSLIISCTSPVRQNVENQKAFAKTYGYVKYFHPSDEASSIDWDKFAIYGAGQVENCKSQEELIETLYAIFKPIAPSIKFYEGEEPISYDFEKITPKDTIGYDFTYWQHTGVSKGMANYGRPYKSIRVNRDFEIDNSSSFGNIMTSINASKYSGKEFRYTGWVKVEKGSKGTGSLWFRVDKSDGTMGFFNNMGSSPITENVWKQYEIKGTIDSLASNLAFGCFLNGKGKLLLDDVVLDYREGEEWVSIPLENSGFEGEKITDEGQWRHSGSGYDFSVSDMDKNEGVKSAIIQYEGNIQKEKGIPIFDQKPEFGKLISKKIAENIFCQIPVMLYSKDEFTYPKSREEDVQLLIKEIENSVNDTTKLAFRLGNVINVYNVFQHFYPYFDVIDVNWSKEFEKALLRSYTDANDKDHLTTLQKFTATLKDGHIRVSSGKMETFVPPFAWEWVENKLIITDVYDSTIDLAIGDEILKIDGQSSISFFAEVNSKISAGTDGWLKHRAQTESLYGPKDSKIVIEAKDESFELVRDNDIYQSNRQNSVKKITYKEINGDVFYLNLDLVKMDTINKLLPKLEGYNSIIFDLRGYPKGNHGLISHLLKAKDTTKGWMQVPQFIYPDQEEIANWESFEWGIETATPYLGDKQIIFITDGSAISYAESFMGFIEGYSLGTIIGQPTAGTNGNINPFQLPGGYRLSWTGMKVNKHDGSQHHAIGVTPDVYLSKTIEGIKAGKDEFLEKAIEMTEQ